MKGTKKVAKGLYQLKTESNYEIKLLEVLNAWCVTIHLGISLKKQ